MATKNELDERLNSPMRIFIGGKFIGESDTDKRSRHWTTSSRTGCTT